MQLELFWEPSVTNWRSSNHFETTYKGNPNLHQQNGFDGSNFAEQKDESSRILIEIDSLLAGLYRLLPPRNPNVEATQMVAIFGLRECLWMMSFPRWQYRILLSLLEPLSWRIQKFLGNWPREAVEAVQGTNAWTWKEDPSSPCGVGALVCSMTKSLLLLNVKDTMARGEAKKASKCVVGSTTLLECSVQIQSPMSYLLCNALATLIGPQNNVTASFLNTLTLAVASRALGP